MFFFKGKKKHRNRGRNRGTRSSYKSTKKASMGYVQTVMLFDAILKKKRLFVYAE